MPKVPRKRRRRKERTISVIQRWRNRRAAERIGHARGKFLDFTWRIERKLSHLIATALVEDEEKRSAFLEIIMGRHNEMTFSVKSEILEQVHEVFPFMGIEPGMFKLLKSVREFRNKLAHSVFNPNGPNGHIEVTRLVRGRVIKENLRPEELEKKTVIAKSLNKLLTAIIEYKKADDEENA